MNEYQYSIKKGEHIVSLYDNQGGWSSKEGTQTTFIGPTRKYQKTMIDYFKDGYEIVEEEPKLHETMTNQEYNTWFAHHMQKVILKTMKK